MVSNTKSRLITLNHMNHVLVTIRLFHLPTSNNLPDEFISPFPNLPILSGNSVVFDSIFALISAAMTRKSFDLVDWDAASSC